MNDPKILDVFLVLCEFQSALFGVLKKNRDNFQNINKFDFVNSIGNKIHTLSLLLTEIQIL